MSAVTSTAGTGSLVSNPEGAKTLSKNERGLTTDMSTAEVLKHLHKVFAAGAHVAPYGAEMERFEAVASALNRNEYFSVEADLKSVRNRY